MENFPDLTYSLTYKDVVDILKMIKETEAFREIHLEFGQFKLSIVRDKRGPDGDPVPPRLERMGARVPQSSGEQEKNQDPAAAAAETGKITTSPYTGSGDAEVRDITGHRVTAPLVGVFYRASAPDASPFVEVGSRVKEDDIVGIIDVMKVMNTIKAGCPGVVREICVNNEQMVHYGQVLMIIDPVID